MADSDKLDLIIQELSNIKEELKNNTEQIKNNDVHIKNNDMHIKNNAVHIKNNAEQISSLEKMLLRRTDELKKMDEAILDEVGRVHRILDDKTKKLESKIG